MPAKEYDYLKDTILVTYPDGPETYGATQAAPSSGVDTSDATAVADDIRVDKTAYTASGKVTGTIEDYDGSTEPASGKSLFAQRIDGSLTEVSAGDLAGITEITAYAFYQCSSLTSITIGNSVTSIGNSAFSYCGTSAESGTTYTFLSTTPSTIKSNTFQNAKINKIIVPVGTADVYKAATNWSALADYIEEATA